MNLRQQADRDVARECELLNRLRRIVRYSLAAYLPYAHPWKRRNMEKAKRLLEQLAADEQRLAEQLAAQIERLGGMVEGGGFPTRFTALHDLSFEFLLAEVLSSHRRDVEAVDQAAALLDPACSSHALVQEIVGILHKHLDELEAVVERNAGAAKSAADPATASPSNAESAHATPTAG